LFEERHQKAGAVDVSAGLDAQGGRRPVHVCRELVLGEIHVDPDPEHEPVIPRLREDPRNLPAPDQQVVRKQDLRSHPGLLGDRVRGGQACDDRQLGEARRIDLRPEVDRDQDARARGRMPRATESASSGRLLLRNGDGALRRNGRELSLRRLATLEIEVGTAEAPAKERFDDRRGERVVTHVAETRLTGLTALSREEIEAILPHRDPFLLLDEVVDLAPGERVVARKRVRPDEWYLSGHFPGRPIMPGVLIVEAMAQAGAVAVLSEEENRGKLALFAGIDGVRFKRVVEPGDVLELTCVLERVRGPIGRGKATAKVDGQLAARGTLTFAVEQ
jgi:3-hydroxyacyl-[acyl-carrier-protein] dehydratase